MGHTLVTAKQVHNQRFTSQGLVRRAYDEDEVDGFLDEVSGTLMVYERLWLALVGICDNPGNEKFLSTPDIKTLLEHFTTMDIFTETS